MTKKEEIVTERNFPLKNCFTFISYFSYNDDFKVFSSRLLQSELNKAEVEIFWHIQSAAVSSSDDPVLLSAYL